MYLSRILVATSLLCLLDCDNIEEDSDLHNQLQQNSAE